MNLLPFEAESKTGLSARRIDSTIHPEMRCQLGVLVNQRFDLPPIPSSGPRIGTQFQGLNGTFPVFYLKAHGTTFEEAIAMLRKKSK